MKIEWKGGECPVSGDTIVHVWFRDGKSDGIRSAGDWRWYHKSTDDDIIAYEVIEEAQSETSDPKQIMASEKTLWDEYALAFIGAVDFTGLQVEDTANLSVLFADSMMKARTK